MCIKLYHVDKGSKWEVYEHADSLSIIVIYGQCIDLFAVSVNALQRPIAVRESGLNPRAVCMERADTQLAQDYAHTGARHEPAVTWR